jgi:hypothetical protein
MRFLTGLFVMVACAALAPLASADAGFPTFARIIASEGVPPDSLGGRDFWAAFRGAFMRTMLPTERPSAREGEFTVSTPASNRFALLEGSESVDAYGVQLVLETLPAEPAAPGGKAPREVRVRVSVAAWPPKVDPSVVRLAAVRSILTLKPNKDRQAFARLLGRSTAVLALEHLHHLNGDLPGDERLRVEQAGRATEPPAEEAAPDGH